MNFFEHQDQAHRESKKLLFLFLLAVVAIVVAVNFVGAGLWIWTKGGGHFAAAHVYPKGYFLTISIVTILVIAGGSLFQMAQLKDGGDAVAEMAGGRLVDPNSRDRQERRLLNIVEEMALASGIACPKVYILDQEDAINAFAAGYHQNEAVVAVTRGTLNRLNRDELQGVIGHEFSHIMNGDMRMNVKLIGVLFGIQMIAGVGEILLNWGARFGSSRSRDEKGPSIQLVMIVLGAAFFAIGYIGIFCGRLIKSAVSRQREYLADASAVQFTRNPDGIGGALKKIGGLTKVNQCGSRIQNPNAEQLSHMFLGAAKPSLLSGMFATHPPIETRLERLYGRPVDFLNADVIEEASEAGQEEMSNAMGFAANPIPWTGTTVHAETISPANAPSNAMAFHPEFGYQTVESKTPEVKQSQSTIPHEIRGAARDPQAASALVYSLLLDRADPKAYQLQIEILNRSVPQLCAMATLFLEQTEKLSRATRLPILDLATPALRSLDVDQKKQLMAVVSRLIIADQTVTQAEFVLQTILERRLSEHSGRAVPVRYHKLAELHSQSALLLSLVAHTHGDRASIVFDQVASRLQEVSLQNADFVAKESIDYFQVKQSLAQLNQLAPLAKPFFIRGLMQMAGDQIEVAAADLIKTICAAIDAPVPDQVNERYPVN